MRQRREKALPSGPTAQEPPRIHLELKGCMAERKLAHVAAMQSQSRRYGDADTFVQPSQTRRQRHRAIAILSLEPRPQMPMVGCRLSRFGISTTNTLPLQCSV